MATANTAAKNEHASDFAADWGSATLEIKAGATVLATHTLAGFSGTTNPLTANAIADVTIAATGTADSAILKAGTKEYSLTVGTSGTDVVVTSTAYSSGNTSKITSLTVTF